MRTFKIPFSYTINGEIEIEANNLGSAISKFNVLAQQAVNPTGHNPILDKATKLVPDIETFEVDEDEAEDINPPIKWNVHVTRTQTAVIEVEAHDADEAEELANQQIYQGEEEDNFEDESIEVTDVEEAD